MWLSAVCLTVQIPSTSSYLVRLTKSSTTGGTAGCVLASRLSEDPNTSVLVLERGVANDTWISRIPLVGSNILSPDMGATSWYSEPLKHCDGRRNQLFRGEVLGGTSRINALIYTRGSVGDYETWASMGHPEWTYEKLLPYFVKAEKTISRPPSYYRGDSGEPCRGIQMDCQ